MRKNLKNKKGITLIALVVTIIILIILAGVSINLLFNEYGIITRAQKAKSDMEVATMKEEIQLQLLDLQMEKMRTNSESVSENELEAIITQAGGEVVKDEEGNITGVKVGDAIIPIEEVTNGVEIGDSTPVEIKTIQELRESGEYVSKKTTAKDSNDNLIEIPKGFKVATDSGINVTEGIVIEDKDIKEGIGNNRGNQYVWIPVGEGIKKSDGTEVDITLGRYIFADGTNHKDSEGNPLEKGTPILKQNIENYEDETAIHITEIYPTSTKDYEIKELKTNRVGVASDDLNGLNATALSISNFKTSVENNKGFYIARYEASYGEDGKANSKVSNSYGDSIPTTEGTLWNCITQIDATVASRNIYEQSVAKTDLMNSYAWDTAIVYIQKFSNDTDYSYQDGKSINSSLTNTGANGDEVCKINDMASNTYEWTTEYSAYIDSSNAFPCTDRGGAYNYNIYYTSSRDGIRATISIKDRTFRTALYM